MGCCRARTLAFLTLVTVHAAAQHTTSSGVQASPPTPLTRSWQTGIRTATSPVSR